MRRLDNYFRDLSLSRYRVSIADLFGRPSDYEFYAIDCNRAVDRLKIVMHDYPGFVVDFNTLCYFDRDCKGWRKCILWDEEE